MLKKAQPFLIGAIFIAAGTLHFTKPAMYEQIVPPYMPSPKTLVAVSGFFEILGGIGVLPAPTRRAAAWGLVALLLAVFPANVYMATDAEKFAKVAPAWVFYGRLPLQLVLIWWVYRSCIAADE